MELRIALAAALICTLSACGGGGDDPPPDPQAKCLTEAEPVRPGTLRMNTGIDSGDSPGASDGGGNGDGAGSLGQFRNTIVVVRDKNLVEIGRAVTDHDNGAVTILLGKCREPIEVEYSGGDGATYYDESTGQFEPFPAGERLRARFPFPPRRFGVTPYTEAAVRLMDSGSGGPMKVLDSEAIQRANLRISELLTDHVAGSFRSEAGGFGLIDITGRPVVLNDQNAKTPGTLTDTPEGRYGAIIAGFIRAAGTFGGTPRSTTVGRGGARAAAVAQPSVTLRAVSQLIDDLSDGQLDMQGPQGPVVAADEAPAYTYETLWRAGTVAAAITTQEAGDATLQRSSSTTKLAEYVFSLAKTYKTATCLEPNCEPYDARSTAGQTVRLYGDGRLTTQRGVSAAFGVRRSYYSAQTEPSEQEVVSIDPSSNARSLFVDVKIGSRGQVIALQQDRRAFVHMAPMQPYIVRGDEAANQSSDYYRQFLIPTLGVVQTRMEVSGDGKLSVVSFSASPAREDRTYPNGVAPDFIYVLSDGSMWGVALSQPTQPFKLPQPEPLQSVVYDQFVPPAIDPAYGRSPTQVQQLPWTGPRRLFGLTRSGDVRVWLEGEEAAGVRLAVPGKVVLLAAESKTGVYALTGDGKVFWLNADQAHIFDSGGTMQRLPNLSQHARRFPLHHVEAATGIDQPICWIGRTEAIACKTGAIFRWTEELARIEYNEQDGSRHSTYLPVGARVQAAREGGVSPVWRISAVDEFYRISTPGESLNVAGLRFIKVDGTTTSLEEERGQRNLVTTLHTFPATEFEPPGDYQYLTGQQLRVALASLFNAQAAIGLERVSTTPQGQHRLQYSIQPALQDAFDMRILVDDSIAPQQPAADMRVEFRSSASGIDHLRFANMHAGDRETYASRGTRAPSDVPIRDPVVLPDSTFIRADITFRAWDLYYFNSISQETDIARVRLIPNFIQSRPYEFRLCFAIEGQSTPGAVRFSRSGCTVHDNFGNFLRRITGLASHAAFINGVRQGDTVNIDFGQLFEAD